MSVFRSSTPFDLTGEFGGVVLTAGGKHRLLLRVEGAERLFKVPKYMRRRLAGNFRAGQVLRVSGEEERDLFTGLSKWVVATVQPLGAVGVPAEPVVAVSPLPSGPIRVCAKKNCWRQGGRELCAALEHGLKERGLDGQVQVKAVGCLDRCSGAPNVDWGGREFSRCRLSDVESILDRAATRPVAVSEG